MNIREFDELLGNKDMAILCGNGMSMNFDSGYGNLYDRFYESHKSIMRDSNFEVIGGTPFIKSLTSNFKAISKYLYGINKSQFYKLFEDAVLFAESILDNSDLIERLCNDKKVQKLVFGIDQLNIIKLISKTYRDKGLEYVNIEFWTILLYFYYSIGNNYDDIYKFPKANSFISLLEIGASFSYIIDNQLDSYGKSLVNGFTTYYRLLLADTIMNNGKSVTAEDLDRIDNIDLIKYKTFIRSFSRVMTTNYDWLIEKLVEVDVLHIHGSYSLREVHIFNQSLSVNCNGRTYFCSDLTIGDYFTFKSFLPVTNNLMKGKNKRIHTLQDDFGTLFNDCKCSTILIFGLSIENDQHIIRNLILELFNNNVDKPQIIYSYFNDGEDIIFRKEVDKLITFRSDVNEYCHNMELKFIRTQDLLAQYFYK